MESALSFLASIFGRVPANPGDALPLHRAPTGVALRVQAISIADPVRSDRLAALGLAPGSLIEVRQRYPALVIDVGETTIALDADLARVIEVRRA
jgi:Fe2+ transport system protein FeoA